MRKPSVVFVCVKNGGKSQMAAGLMRKVAAGSIDVYSAGTEPGSAINALSQQSLQELGIDLTGEQPKAIDTDLSARLMSWSRSAAKQRPRRSTAPDSRAGRQCVAQ